MNEQTPRRRVLVVDDDPHLLNLLEIRLSDEGFNVSVASSAPQALEKVSLEPPDLVIADIMMPGMDGYELCERIRSNERLRNIPFIFLSALADTQDKVKGLRLGADDYLTKPFEFHELLARIEILMDRYARYQATFQREAAITTTGNIEDLGVIDLLQMLSFGQKTGEVHLESRGEEGYFYLAAGKLISAIYRQKQGLAALATLLSWSEGRFSIKFTESLSQIPNIQNPTDEAIFEALKELDDTERIKQELEPEGIPVLKSQSEPETDAERVVGELADGRRTINEILKESPLSDIATLEAIRNMVKQEAITLRFKKPEQEAAPEVFNLMVIGTDREARNAFIRALSGESAPPEDKVLNFGTIEEEGYHLNLYGLPGDKRFAPLWQTFISKVQGVILLADADSEEELTNLRFAISLLRPKIQGPTIVINTDPTHPDIPLGAEGQGLRTLTCLPSDRIKAAGILRDILAELAR